MDEFMVQPALHQAVGGLTLLAALVAVVLTALGPSDNNASALPSRPP